MEWTWLFYKLFVISRMCWILVFCVCLNTVCNVIIALLFFHSICFPCLGIWMWSKQMHTIFFVILILQLLLISGGEICWSSWLKLSIKEKYTYRDHIIEFLECLYVNYYFEGAQLKLVECEKSMCPLHSF